MNLRERLTATTPDTEQQKILSSEMPKSSSPSSPNCSSAPSSPLFSMMDMDKEIQRLRKELQEKEALLQEMKELDSMHSSQISTLKQELEENVQSSLSEIQLMQSTLAEMTAELAAEKQQKHQIEILSQKLVEENDDLRNQNGMKTQAEMDGILDYDNRLREYCSELEAQNADFREKINWSLVSEIEQKKLYNEELVYRYKNDADDASRRALHAFAEARQVRMNADNEIAGLRKELKKSKHKMIRFYLYIGLLIIAELLNQLSFWNRIWAVSTELVCWIAKE